MQQGCCAAWPMCSCVKVEDHGVAELAPLPVQDEQESDATVAAWSEVLQTVPSQAKWALTRKKVHFMSTEVSPPWCAQRKGTRARPLMRVAASGEGTADLLSLGVEDNYKLCMDCIVAMQK